MIHPPKVLRLLDMEIKVTIPALENMVDHTASGIGSVVGTMLLPWRADQEAGPFAISRDAVDNDPFRGGKEVSATSLDDCLGLSAEPSHAPVEHCRQRRMFL